MATIGPWSGRVASDPSNVASPNANTPPSALASRYPLPSGVATPENTGEFEGLGHLGLVEVDVAEADHPAVRVDRCAGAGAMTTVPTANATGASTVATMRVTVHDMSPLRRHRRKRPGPAPPLGRAVRASSILHAGFRATVARRYEVVTTSTLNTGVASVPGLVGGEQALPTWNRRTRRSGMRLGGRSPQVHGRMGP